MLLSVTYLFLVPTPKIDFTCLEFLGKAIIKRLGDECELVPFVRGL